MTRYEVTWQERVTYRAYVEAESLDEAMEMRELHAVEVVDTTGMEDIVVEEQA